MASEACDNSGVAGTLVPTLTLGVPGSGTAAVMLAALYLHGVQPGPRVMVNHGPEVYAVLLGVLLTSILILPFGVLLATPLASIIRLRSAVLVPPTLLMAGVGAFAARTSVFDVGVALAFGIVGFILKHYGYPVIPIVIGLVLGPIAEENFMRGLQLGHGSLLYFFESPIAIALWTALVVTFGWRAVRPLIRRMRHGGRRSAAEVLSRSRD